MHLILTVITAPGIPNHDPERLSVVTDIGKLTAGV